MASKKTHGFNRKDVLAEAREDAAEAVAFEGIDVLIEEDDEYWAPRQEELRVGLARLMHLDLDDLSGFDKLRLKQAQEAQWPHYRQAFRGAIRRARAVARKGYREARKALDKGHGELWDELVEAAIAATEEVES